MDELGNTESNYFDPTAEPEEQKKSRQEEKGKIQEGIRLLEEIIARWDKRIAFYDTVDSIEVDIATKPEEHLRAVIAAKNTKINLTQEKEYLENLRNTYK